MDFYAVLDRVIDLLRNRGRVTYGALKLQFGLNDEQLAVLKDEIISAQRLATDEDGKILVWLGDTTGATKTASPPARPTQQAPLQQNQHTPEAERRQLTVMFCAWWTPRNFHRNSTLKSTGRWYVHISGSA